MTNERSIGLIDDSNNREFRAALDRAVLAENQFVLTIIADRVVALASRFSRHINVVQLSSRRSPLLCVNCFAYALGLSLAGGDAHLAKCVDRDFVEHLLELGILKPRPSDLADDGDILLYRNGAELRHAGVVTGSTVRSKWGSEGSIFEHSALSVPDSYGSNLSVFELSCPDDVLNELRHYRAGTKDPLTIADE